jgi:CheY-like chemotaxis protein
MDRAGRGVLVADDDPTIREPGSVLLEGEGHRVTTAANGREPPDALEGLRPDVIVLDMRMPVLDARAACSRVTHPAQAGPGVGVVCPAALR